MQGISLLYGATDTCFMDFWWCHLWVSKPKWAAFICASQRRYVLYIRRDFILQFISASSGGSRISPRRGRQLPGGRQHVILPIFSKNCMKLKEFGPRGGRCVPRAPLRSATGQIWQNLPDCLSWKTRMEIVLHYRRILFLPPTTFQRLNKTKGIKEFENFCSHSGLTLMMMIMMMTGRKMMITDFKYDDDF